MLLLVIWRVVVIWRDQSNSVSTGAPTAAPEKGNASADSAKTIDQKPSDVSTTSVTSSSCTPESCIMQIGKAPFDDEHIRSELAHFQTAMKDFEKKGNKYGTQAPHQFALFCFVRWLKPKHIIESGAYKGLGTWLLRKAAPEAQIIVISPEQPALYVDAHSDSKYYTETKFQDFTELEDEWKNLDKDRTLVFFDDHQSGFLRTKQAAAVGFRHIVFDDNYSPGKGDNFSIKMALDGEGVLHKLLGATPEFRDNFNDAKKYRVLSPEELSQYAQELKSILKVYYEFPPLWDLASTNRFQFPPEKYRAFTKSAILRDGEDSKKYFAPRARASQATAYTHMCYLEVEPSSL